MKKLLIAAVIAAVSVAAQCGVLDKAWLKGVTDKDPVSYRAGEKITLAVMPMALDGEIPSGEYFLDWKRTDDFGATENGRVPLSKEPFIYTTSLDRPGFVRLEAYVVDKNGKRYQKKFTGDTTTPEGRRAMNEFEKKIRFVYFDGGAGVDVGKLAPAAAPKDFDAFWAGQFKRLELVPMKSDRAEIESPDATVRLYAVRVDCAGLRPVTGYLSVPKAVQEGRKFRARLETHGYNGDRCVHNRPWRVHTDEIVFNINAHGLKLKEFGATEADTKMLRCEIRSNGNAYAFDPKQNEDPETAYFNGMVLRVKRALQYLKTVEGWNGDALAASGGSQGGLQTIWAAGCGEGVTLAEASVPWCCDMPNNNARRDRKISSDGWYVPWTESMGYYDAVNFAKRIPKTCHTSITRAGLGDYCCPPMGIAKLWNAIPGNKSIKWVQGSQHGYVPPEYEGRDFERKAE